MKIDYLTGSEQKAMAFWHGRWLKNNLADRARLRRAERAEDVLLSNAFFTFLKKMPEDFPVKVFENKKMFAGSAVAGLLSHVKEHKPSGSFAKQLGTPAVGRTDTPPMSELRFQQLLKSRNTDDFYLRIVRAIRLLDGKVNIISLANDILHWHLEFNNQPDRNPANRLAVRWATDYFTVPSK